MAWTEEEDSVLIAAYRAGDTLAATGALLDRPVWAIDERVRALRAAGINLPARKSRWTPERRAELARRRRDGASLSQLEREFGITRGTLTYHLRRLKTDGAL